MKKEKIRIVFADLALCSMVAIGGFSLGDAMNANHKKKEQKIRLEKELDYIKENLKESDQNQEISICSINVQNKYTSENSNFQSGSNLVVSLAEEDMDIIGIQERKCKTRDILKKIWKNMNIPSWENLYGEMG